jgi:predicted RNA-binding protein with RPS1 domain
MHVRNGVLLLGKWNIYTPEGVQDILVKVIEIDKQGRINLSRKDALLDKEYNERKQK